MAGRLHGLGLLHPQRNTQYISQNRTVLATAADGFLDGGGGHGLFVHQTRMLSRYRYLIDDKSPQAVTLSNVTQHSWVGYYVAPPPKGERHKGKGKESASEHSIELRLFRQVGDGFHEDVNLTNYTGFPASFTLTLEVGADFLDARETKKKERKQHGRLDEQWRPAGPGAWELHFDYRAEHAYDHQGEKGTARLHRGLTLRIENAGSPPAFQEGRISFAVAIAPLATWHACVSAIPFVEDGPLSLRYGCPGSDGRENEFERKRSAFLAGATHFSNREADTLTPVVIGALEQAKNDLAAMRLYEYDTRAGGWIAAGGLPIYVALFGRDTLITAWDSALMSTDLLRGALEVLPRTQGTKTDDWRDEQPGRMIHQVQTAPLSVLNYDPLGRYYGTVSAPVFYAEALFNLWLWTGDEGQVRPFVEPALKGLRWLDDYGDLDGDGFYEYRPRSEKGLKNQAWKDSGQAIVYEDGTQVPDPIATCETQALAYLAKSHMAELLWWLGRKDEAEKLNDQAEELKKHFNDAFWMPDRNYLAVGLDPKKRQIRTITSDAGACLAAAAVDESRVRAVADRLMAPDMFSGWGVRTLAAGHPSYNPFSYQRGAVWPVENGILALAFLRYGLHGHVNRLCRAQFEAAALFDYYRLPEVFSGHPRDAEHPVPAMYPDANWPQAWSCGAVFCFLQALLNLLPFAPLNLLILDPYLPEWLPEITLRNLHVGRAVADLHFYRTGSDRSDFEVLDVRGPLHVVRQPSPWSLTATYGERLRDALVSLLPGK